MRIFAWMRDHLLATVVCYLTVVAVTVLSGIGIAVWLVAVLLVGGSTGVLLHGVLAVLIATLLVGSVVAFVSLVGIGFGLYARVSRAVTWADETLLRVTDIVRTTGSMVRSVAADVAAPPESHPGATGGLSRLDRVKAAYVKGALSEREFERRVDDHLDAAGREADR
jgi:hypothetical protein